MTVELSHSISKNIKIQYFVEITVGYNAIQWCDIDPQYYGAKLEMFYILYFA